MCFHSQQSKSAIELQHRFKAKFDNPDSYNPSIYNGFQHPYTAVITNENQNKLDLYQWGLMPHWAKDKTIQKCTLNARIETIGEKPSFRDCLNQRCIIPADGFFEWQWLDAKGKNKRKYFIHLPGEELFAFAGLWSKWTDKTSGEIMQTYTILTTDANTLMAEIHNTQKRMPVILHPDNETEWLKGNAQILGNDRLIVEAT